MIKVIIHSADWQYNESSEHVHNAFNHAAKEYFKKMAGYSLEYGRGGLLQVIAGDIFDRKENSTIGEFLRVKDFLKTCCSYSETIIVLGNHDYDIRNKQRPTLLRLLVDSFEIDGLVFYEKSGTYEYSNQFRFFVYSHLDSSKRPDNFEENLKKDRLNIGLYHNPLSNAKDFNPNVKYNKYPTPSIFDGLDCVMMGDIHKRQVINQERGVKAIYSGSPYQRNWGEDVNNHGIVKWDMSNLSFEFVDLDSPYKLIKLEVDAKEQKYNILNP